MPLRWVSQQPDPEDAPYFDSLSELDSWAAKPSKRLTGILKYCARHPIVDGVNQGKLLVCHDYKGGYTESPHSLSYTFNFWPLCDTFVYFSHHCVTIPPPGWITAAHRQGVRILGTLIFEGSAEADCLRLLVGNPPNSKAVPSFPPTGAPIPVSRHYARLLADLAHQRGFDGYLLNFECPLRGGLYQTKALAAWNTLLQSELREKVGPHSQAIWYDSVIYTGQLLWQDRLNSFNLPFFLSSTSFFTNYTWPPHYPNLTAQYFLSLNPSVVSGSGPHERQPKTLQSIFMGVDVWGRGSHGGGGLGCYKAITHIDPQSLGLSVALFGQAWTWESEQDKPGWTWESWWEYERKLWVGPTKGIISIPEAPRKPGEPECIHGPFLPLRSFFAENPPPDPADLAFHSTFCPGVGRTWFIAGTRVFQAENGWTDINKQSSLGDMVWPRPTPAWEGEWTDDLPEVSSALCMDDAWNGGSCLRLALSFPGLDSEDALFRCIWLPVQSLTVTRGMSYEATAVYKVDAGAYVDLDLGLSAKLLGGGNEAVELFPCAVNYGELPHGWRRLSVRFVANAIDTSLDGQIAIGLIIGFAPEDPTQSLDFSILLGQLNVFPTRPPTASAHELSISWANFERVVSENPTNLLSGILTWDVTVSLAPVTVKVTSPEDPIPVWELDTSKHWFPSFVYFNIYAQCHPPDGPVGGPESAMWIGTTGLDGRDNRFVVTEQMAPVIGYGSTDGVKKVRLYVRGVTDHGEVLEWDQSVLVDVDL